jgi:hypothetical protein
LLSRDPGQHRVGFVMFTSVAEFESVFEQVKKRILDMLS